MSIVLDASVVSQLIVPDIHSAQAFALVADVQARGEALFGPILLPIEMTNIIRKRMRSDRLTLRQAHTLLDDFLAYDIELLNPADLHHRALTLTEAHSLGAHDAHYVALAAMLGCDLWVDDSRLLNAVRGRLTFVRWIGDYGAQEGRTAAT